MRLTLPLRPASTPMPGVDTGSRHCGGWAPLCCGLRSLGGSAGSGVGGEVASAAPVASPALADPRGMDRFAVADGSGSHQTPQFNRPHTSRRPAAVRSFTGKPARMLRNSWTEAQNAGGEAARYAVAIHGLRHGRQAHINTQAETVDSRSTRWGQVVGQFTKVEKDGYRYRTLGASEATASWTHSMLPRPFDNGRQARMTSRLTFVVRLAETLLSFCRPRGWRCRWSP